MPTLKSQKLKHRILWGYSLPILLSMGAATFVFLESNEVSKKSQILAEANFAVRNLKELELGFSRMQKSARGYFLASDDSFLTEYDAAVKSFDQFSTKLNDLVEDPEQCSRLDEINRLQDQIDDLYRRVFVLISQGKQEQGISLWRTEVIDKLRQVETLTKAFENVEENILADRSKEQGEALELLTIVVLVGTLLASALGIGIALWIASGITQTISQTASEIASSSTEIAATVEQQERTAAQQAASVSQTTTTMDELGASARLSAEQAETAATQARQVLALVDGRHSNIQEQRTLEVSSSLREKVGQIAEQILRLSEQTSLIGSISNAVSDLANQTNMLALNAAVEAVRAGEHGKGFGVVASEIRKLADQSRNSAERINALVNDIQKATNSTVIVTDEGTKTVEGIVAAINDIALNSQQISMTAKQQAVAIQQVVEAMNMLNQGAVETASGISQTRTGTQKLNEAALNLQAVV